MNKATIGGGCFWCIESVFEMLDGVESVVSGYAGGSVDNPSYRQVCSGTTGHAEVVQLHYDSSVISYEELLEVFFEVHNPETKDREGPDTGSQYRSIILYHSKDQKTTAEQKIQQLEEEPYDNIVTEVSELQKFYEAEKKHQDFFEKNPSSGYCQVQIPPKQSKVREKFGDKL